MSDSVAVPPLIAHSGMLNEAQVMDRSANKMLRWSTAALILSSHAALATTEGVGPEAVLLGLLMVVTWPLGEFLDEKIRRTYRTLTNLITLAVIPLLPYLYSRSEFNLVVPVAVLILYIEWHKLVHKKVARDYYQLFLMTFFVLLAACAQNPDASFALALMAYVFSAVWAFFSLQVFVESHANVNHPAADVVDLGSRMGGTSTRSRRLIDARVVGSLFLICIGALSLTIGAFVFTPRMEAGLLGANTSMQMITALDEEVDLSGGGLLGDSERLVMHVRFPDEPNGAFANEKYWRTVTLDRYFSGSWRRGQQSPNETFDELLRGIYFVQENAFSIRRSRIPDTRLVKQQIFFDDSSSDVLPVLPLVYSLTIQGARVQWNGHEDFCVLVDNRKIPSVNYVAESELLDYTPAELRHLRSDPSTPLTPAMGEAQFPINVYRFLTSHDLAPELVELSYSLTEDAESTYDKMAALSNYLSGSEFLYTRNIPPFGAKPVDEFLSFYKRGHCEMFASALALMARSIGIPTRVVQGYRGGDYSETDQTYTVRENMAHLWVEAYFPEYGWITFDPSPAGDDEANLSAFERMTRWWSRKVLEARMLWYRDVVAFEGGIRIRDIGNYLRGIVRLDFQSIRDTAMRGTGIVSFMPKLFLGLTVVFAFLWFVVLRFYVRPRNRIGKGAFVLSADQRRAVRLFKAFRKTLRKYGMHCEGKTSGEILRMAAASGQFAMGDLTPLVQTYDLVRFGGRGLSPAMYGDLMRSVKALRPIAPPASGTTGKAIA